jgi:hypothetical protein
MVVTVGIATDSTRSPEAQTGFAPRTVADVLRVR